MQTLKHSGGRPSGVEMRLSSPTSCTLAPDPPNQALAIIETLDKNSSNRVRTLALGACQLGHSVAELLVCVAWPLVPDIVE